MVSYCTQPGHGSRLMPKGALTGVHFVQTPHYLQITSVPPSPRVQITPTNSW